MESGKKENKEVLEKSWISMVRRQLMTNTSSSKMHNFFDWNSVKYAANVKYRVYHVAAQRLTKFLFQRTLKNVTRASVASKWNSFEHKKRNFLSPSSHIKVYSLLTNTNGIPNHFTFMFFGMRQAWLFIMRHSNVDLFTCDNIMFSRGSRIIGDRACRDFLC